MSQNGQWLKLKLYELEKICYSLQEIPRLESALEDEVVGGHIGGDRRSFDGGPSRSPHQGLREGLEVRPESIVLING